MAQSSVPLYSHCSLGFSACICRRRRTVSNGYEMKPAMIAVVCAIANLDTNPMMPLSFFHGLSSLSVSKTPKYGPRYLFQHGPSRRQSDGPQDRNTTRTTSGGVLDSEGTVRDDADHRYAEARVHREETAALHRLHEAISKALELHIRSQARANWEH